MGWNNAANWSTSSNAITPNPSAVPGSADIAVFNITTVNTNQTVGLFANQAALGLQFNSTGTVQITDGSGNRTLTLGASGITVNSGAGAVTISNATLALGAAQTWSNNSSSLLTVSSAVTNGGNLLTITGTGNTTISGVISGSGGLTKNGSGILTLSGTAANTYTGTTTVNAGELDLNKTAGVNAIAGNLVIGDGTGTDTVKLLAANQIADTAAVQIDGTSGVLNLNGNNETIGSLADRTGGTGTAGSVLLGTGTLTISPTSGSTTFSGVISGGGNLVKTGSGTQVLAGNNTYTGTTTISGGTLTISRTGSTGKLGGTSGITLNSGGTLLLAGSGGNDRINNSATLTLNGGTFNTGGFSEGAAGTTGIGALTLTSTSTINFGSTNTSVIQFAGVGTQTNGQILQLINWNGSVYGGSGDRLLFAGTVNQFTSLYDQSEVSFNGVTGYNIYQYTGFYEVTAVPEPGTWFGASLALLAVLYIQRGRLLRLKRVEVRKD
jgi:autotransporter-associated beta strand protein